MVRKIVFAAMFSCFGFPLWAGPAEDCDRLAADPAVALAEIQPEAEAACEEALQLDDTSARLMHQYARTLERGGNLPAALRYYEWAAEDGYPPAALSIARLGGDAPEISTTPSPLTDYAAGQGAEGLSAALSRDITLLPHGKAIRSAQSVLSQKRGSGPDIARAMAALILARDPTAELRFGLCMRAAVHVAPQNGQIKPPSLLALFTEAQARGDISPAIRQRLDDIVAALTVAFDDGRHVAKGLAADLRALNFTAPVAADTETHVVVEQRAGETWQAWDPVLGAAFDPAGCTTYETARDLPAAMFPTFHVQIRADDGTSRVLFDSDVPLSGSAVFGFAESWGLTPPDGDAPKDGITATPVVISGDRVIYGQSLILPKPKTATTQTGDAMSGALGEVLDAMGSEPAENGVAVPDTLRRIEMIITLPDAAEPTSTMVLFDRPDAAQPLAEIGGRYLHMMQIVSILALDGSLDAAPPPSTDLPETLTEAALEAELRRAANALNGFENLRRQIFSELSDHPPPLPQSLGLLLTVWTTKADGDETSLTARQQMLRGQEPAYGEDPALTAATWAVASVLAERLSLELGQVGEVGPDAVSVWKNAGAGHRTTEADITGLSEGARARVAARLAAGQIALSPTADLTAPDEAQLAWWFVDPKAGVVEDEFANGWRQAVAEDGAVKKTVNCPPVKPYVSLAVRIRRVGGILAVVMAVVAEPGSEGAKANKDLVEQAVEDSTKRLETENAQKIENAMKGANLACGT